MSHVKIPNKFSSVLKGKLNTDTAPQNFWSTFLENDLTEQKKT